jgi:hypothetical protein
MAKIYRVFPGIGIARLGNSPDSFFLSPEIPGAGPLELTTEDSVQIVNHYKDANRQLRRQAARFRIFEFDDAGATPLEINAASGAQIEWRVELANEKAAAGRFVSENLPENVQLPRNPGVAQTDLIIKPTFPPISGLNQRVTASREGQFRGRTVYLGELRTDAKGRLLVLGGRGQSDSIPAGLPLGDGTGNPGPNRNTFANNAGWFDDVADGPISATIRIAGQPDVVLDNAAWVIVAPPDFSPYTDGITTLFDVASQAAGLPAPATPSFQNDVLPIIKAAARLRFVSALPNFSAITTDYAQLANKTDPAANQLRLDTQALLQIIESGVLTNFTLTANQHEIVNAWVNGNFVSDYVANPPLPPLTPGGIDRASLSQAVGGGFYPGIEAGIRMTAAAMYAEPYRITRQAFTYAGVPQIPHAGFITRTMACPWQSDFFECAAESDTTVWWPAQRPIDVFIDAAATIDKPWIDSVPTHRALVEKFWMLGIVAPVPGATEPLIESERDPAVPH